MADGSELDELQQDLNIFYDTFLYEQLYRILVGDLCAVMYQRRWYRGLVRTINNEMETVTVFLVDFGFHVTVSCYDTRVITTYFASFGPLSFPCRMAALNEDELWLNEELAIKFKHICKNAGSIQMQYLTNKMPYIVRLLVSQYDCTGDQTDAYILSPSYAVLDIEKIQSNRVDWLSSNIIGPKCHNSMANRKFEIIVTAIRSPAEIYVSPRCFDAKKRKMHAAIQRWVIEHQVLDHRDIEWKKGDQCLVHYRRSNDIEMWYRGLIEGTNGNEMQIFLRDFGDVVNVKAEKLMNTAKRLGRMSGDVIKCHLDGVNSWLPTSISIMQSMIGEGYASFAPRANGSVPITLWRPTQKTICGLIVEWMNMNRWLVAATVIEVTEIYIHSTQEQFRADAEWKTTIVESASIDNEDTLFPEHLDLDEILLDDELIETNSVDVEWNEYDEGSGYFRMTQPNFYELNDWADGTVEQWLPSERTEPLKFTGTPVHIDYNGVIYIHDTYREYLAEHLSTFITRTIENDQNVVDPFTIVWTVGQTCFAKYYEKFYRGTIQSINHAKSVCIVKFVDYGNWDPCKFEDMRPATQCGHIPILVRKYCLDNVQPISSDNRWPESTVNVLGTEILHEKCDICVKETANLDIGILPCTVTRNVDRIDLKTRLIEMGLCYERTSVSQQRR